MTQLSCAGRWKTDVNMQLNDIANKLDRLGTEHPEQRSPQKSTGVEYSSSKKSITPEAHAPDQSVSTHSTRCFSFVDV